MVKTKPDDGSHMSHTEFESHLKEVLENARNVWNLKDGSDDARLECMKTGVAAIL